MPGLSSRVRASASGAGEGEGGGAARGDLIALIAQLTEQMHTAAAELQFEVAARIRDEIRELKHELRGMQANRPRRLLIVASSHRAEPAAASRTSRVSCSPGH